MVHKQGALKTAKKTQKKLVSKTNKRLKQTNQTKKNKKPDISLEKLKLLCKKYTLITSGSRKIPQ